MHLILTPPTHSFADANTMFVLDYKNIYSTYRNDMPIIYNLPLFSGQILWITMLNEKIKASMEFFSVNL